MCYVHSLQEMLELVKNYHKVRYFAAMVNSASISAKDQNVDTQLKSLILLTLQYLSYVIELREGFILELSNLGF